MKEAVMAEIQITEDCIGCESCVELCPDVFKMDESTEKAVATDPSSTLDCVDEAMETCPVNAIIRE